jgi:hypothetical protein
MSIYEALAEVHRHFCAKDGTHDDACATLSHRDAIARKVESDMAAQARAAWRAAGARRGLSDHEALLVHADALARWSERFRMAFDGEDYRADERSRREHGGG